MKKLILFIVLGLLSSCGSVIKNLDSSGFSYRSDYQEAETLPLLEVAPELAQSPTPATH